MAPVGPCHPARDPLPACSGEQLAMLSRTLELAELRVVHAGGTLSLGQVLQEYAQVAGASGGKDVRKGAMALAWVASLGHGGGSDGCWRYLNAAKVVVKGTEPLSPTCSAPDDSVNSPGHCGEPGSSWGLPDGNFTHNLATSPLCSNSVACASLLRFAGLGLAAVERLCLSLPLPSGRRLRLDWLVAILRASYKRQALRSWATRTARRNYRRVRSALNFRYKALLRVALGGWIFAVAKARTKRQTRHETADATAHAQAGTELDDDIVYRWSTRGGTSEGAGRPRTTSRTASAMRR
jgi:hypothetical protein